ncbi:hypothetical protein AURANDRAFT_72413 [Aureococcus anophagefferens]|uniref:Ion transport domain-containing protein n=1 Tax=Aureococcus anophagefferens TaxID=44056 RepID=F0YJ30_AURAN|nr:hypothetical protein AURANDRAFT_72413 [Aureococcus anophagefferens]EGB04850.1 hypothetical protein AURANDRAFT_72413 [Aureococcus anophagefferens]|eukprot:XP_009040407.1 hypothetical protein AURANDRAFT_72413 [Aureococcus anophagefferens]
MALCARAPRERPLGPLRALAAQALAVLAARHAAARPSLFLAQDAVPALGALLAPRAPMRRRNADDPRETRRFSPKGGFDAVAPDTAREVDAKVHALRALATVAEADGDGAVAVARELVAQGAANARSPAPRLVILDWDRDVEGADRPAARRLDAALSAVGDPWRCAVVLSATAALPGAAGELVGGMGGEVLPAVNALCCCCEEHVLKGDADAALRSGAGDALADALHDAATPPACVVRLLDAFGRLAAPVARLEADLVPRVLLKRVVLTIRDKLLAAPPPDVARALCRALRDLAKADASGDALPFYLCTKWSCLAAVLVRSLSFVLDEALEALCAIAAVHPGAAQESEIPNVHPGDDPLLPSDGFAALGDLLEDRTPLLGDFGHLGFDDVDRQHECLRHLRENGDVVEARDVAAHLLGARLFRRAEDAEATRILAALARGPAAPRACVALVVSQRRCTRLVAVALLIKLAEDPAGVDAVAEAVCGETLESYVKSDLRGRNLRPDQVEKFSKTLRSALTCSKILQSKIVALYEDAKARRHKLDMREKRAEPSPADIAAAEARANRAAAELLEQLDEEATPPSKKKKKKKKKKKGHRDVAEADWRLNWDIFTMFLIVFVMLVTPFELAFINSVGFNASFKSLSPFEPNQHTGLLIANWFVNLGFVIDVVFNFLTAIHDEQQHRWIMSHSEIAGCYLRSWFVLDAGTIVPIEYFAGSEASLIRLLRLMRLFKLVKVLKSEKLVARVSRHIDMSTKFQTIIKYCVMMLVLIHWSACGLRMVTDYNLKECRYSADQDSRCPETVLTSTGNWGEGVWAIYVEACIWALIALNGEADARTHAECVLGMIIMLVGVIILAFLVGDMSNIMSNLDPVTNEFKQTLDNLNDYMRKKTGFPDALRLRLREYILLSEPVYRDHFNKEMLSKLSPSLQLIVAKQNLGRTVTRMPFTAYTIHSQAGLKRGSRVRVKIFHDLGLPATYKAAVVLSSPALLRYDVKYDDSGRVERDVKHDRIVHDEKPGQGKLGFQVDAFVASVARLLVAQLYMPFDTVIHQGIDLNTVMYVVDSGKVICMNYDKTSTFGISLKQEKDFFGDDIAMLASGDRKPVLRDYAAVATRTTQLHALDAFEFLDFLEASPGLAVFLRHFEKWGCWVRMKRVFLDTKDILGCIRDADRAAKKLRKKRRAATLGVDDTADLLALVADAQRHGAADDAAAAAARSPLATADVLKALGSLVAALRKRREEA